MVMVLYEVCLKICGDCNPQIRIKKLLNTLKDIGHHYKFVTGLEHSCEQVLIINACMVDCIKTPELKKNIINVSGSRINLKEYAEEDLPFKILELLDEYRFKDQASKHKERN